MLGVDWELADGAYRIKHIVSGGALGRRRALAARRARRRREGRATTCSRSTACRSTPSKDPWAAFEGLADETVLLTVNSTPSTSGARQVAVKCLVERSRAAVPRVDRAAPRARREGHRRQGRLRLRAEHRRRRAERARAPVHGAVDASDGLIVDERFNSGGQIPDRFIELLNRPMLSYWAVRDGAAAAMAAGRRIAGRW